VPEQSQVGVPLGRLDECRRTTRGGGAHAGGTGLPERRTPVARQLGQCRRGGSGRTEPRCIREVPQRRRRRLRCDGLLGGPQRQRARRGIRLGGAGHRRLGPQPQSWDQRDLARDPVE